MICFNEINDDIIVKDDKVLKKRKDFFEGMYVIIIFIFIILSFL